MHTWAQRPSLLALALAFGLELGCGDIVLTEGTTSSSEDSGSSTGDDCAIGSLGCVCTPGGGCDPGLECMAGTCVEPISETETGECSELGCACMSETDCDAGLLCVDGTCTIDNCRDGSLDPGEVCDDGNQIDGDGCDNDCTQTEIIQLALGGLHTCVLIEQGRIRCWGNGATGQLGYGSIDSIGDDELPDSAGDLPLPAATSIAPGGAHTCAIFESGDLRCWGFNTSGQLGLGNSALVTAIGDDEPLDNLPRIDLVAPVNGAGAGLVQTCIRESGQLRCWGSGTYGQLGLANVLTIGDDELPNTVAPVMLGGEPVRLAIGPYHGCAIVASGGLRCWGRNDTGQLGLGTNANIGDNEHPADVGEVQIVPISAPPGTTLLDIGAGLNHSCALLSTGEVLCWGAGNSGQLGQGNGQIWGDQNNETPSVLPPIKLGGTAVALAVGYMHSCALLDGGAVRCWGTNDAGQLGTGDELPIGLSDTPADHDPVELGAPAIAISAGGAHTCALLEDQHLMCWGSNEFGQLGYGHTHGIGDDEIPIVAGFVQVL